MKKIAKALTFIVFLGMATLASARDFDYGRPEEMRGLTKFYVDTGADLRAHDEIVNRIGKVLPALKNVDKPEDAEMLLVFVSEERREPGLISEGGLIFSESVTLGDGYVFRSADGRLRLVFTDHPTHGEMIFERAASRKFADAFIAAYRKANR